MEAVRVVTPVGVLETRRLPATGAGPSPGTYFLSPFSLQVLYALLDFSSSLDPVASLSPLASSDAW